MDDTTITLLVVVVCAVILGPLTAISSQRREPIHGGLLAQLLHGIACMTFVGMVPGVLTGIIVGVGFQVMFPLAMTLFISTIIILMAFAAIEQAPRQAAINREQTKGWTEEDARTSGL